MPAAARAEEGLDALVGKLPMDAPVVFVFALLTNPTALRVGFEMSMLPLPRWWAMAAACSRAVGVEPEEGGDA